MSALDDVRAAIEKIQNETYEPQPRYGPLHPADYARIQGDLGLDRPLTDRDIDAWLLAAYERADDEGKAKLLAASFGVHLP